MALRRRRIDANFRRAALTELALLDITTDEDTATIYDAAYLELAHRRTLSLATLDPDIGAAAKAIGIGINGTD